MIAADYDWTCDQGATFDESFAYRDASGAYQNWTGWSARMDIRTAIDADLPALQLTTANGRITLGGTAGTVRLLIAAADTAELPAGEFVYDLEVVSGSTVYRLMRGKFTVRGEVTR